MGKEESFHLILTLQVVVLEFLGLKVEGVQVTLVVLIYQENKC